MAWKFYVYEIWRDGRVIYVGKGCGKRRLQSAKEREGAPDIVAYFAKESYAFDFERQRIAERLAEGCALLNISHGQRVAWDRRTDTQQMAREVLEWMAGRVGRWIKAGKVDELSSLLRMPSEELILLHQRFGH